MTKRGQSDVWEPSNWPKADWYLFYVPGVIKYPVNKFE